MERQEPVAITVHDYELMSDSDSDGELSPRSNSGELKELSAHGMVKLEESDGEYSLIKRELLSGMGFLSSEINVVAIHNAYSSGEEQTKMEAFESTWKAVVARHGCNACPKRAWYGGSRREICNAVNHGFGRCGDFLEGLSHGIGVCLSPVELPIHSAVRGKKDEEGVWHLLLCHLILGKTETISAASQRFQAISSMDFDSAIDDRIAPTKYIVWGAYKNTHILPRFVFSFTAPSLVGRNYKWNFGNIGNAPKIKVSMVETMLSKYLPSPNMGLITDCCNDYRNKKINGFQFFVRLKNLVGAKVVYSLINFLWTYELQQIN